MASSWNVNRLLLALGGLLTAVAIALALAAGAPPPQVIPLVLGVVAALVVAFYAPAWMYLVSGLLIAAFPLVIVFVFGAYNAIIHPGSGAEGAAVTLVLAGAFLGLIGGVAGFVQARRRTQPPARDLLRAPQGLASALLVALFAGLLVSSAWTGSDYRALMGSPAAVIDSPDQVVRVSTVGGKFAPNELAIPAGKLVVLRVTNPEPTVHTFTYHMGDQVRESVIPGNTDVDIPLKLDAPQTIHFWCAPHSMGEKDDGSGMVGTLVVQ